MSTLDGPILLFIGFIVVVLVWEARRVRLSRPLVVFMLAVTVAWVGGGWPSSIDSQGSRSRS